MQRQGQRKEATRKARWEKGARMGQVLSACFNKGPVLGAQPSAKPRLCETVLLKFIHICQVSIKKNVSDSKETYNTRSNKI